MTIQEEYEKELQRLKKDVESRREPIILFEDMIFMGGGEYSNIQCLRAHRQLEQIFSLMSGLQQPNMSTDLPELEGTRDPLEEELNELSQSLVTAIFGKGYKIVKVEDEQE